MVCMAKGEPQKRLVWLRVVAALAIIAVIALLLATFFGPRTITINARGWPLRAVVQAFEKQGRISVLTNVAADKPVTIYLQKVPVPVALQKLATAIGAEFRIGYILAPGRRQLSETAADWEVGAFQGAWYQLRSPIVGAPREHPENAAWKVEPEPTATLDAYLRQGSVSTGLCFLLNGNPDSKIATPPKSGTMDKTVRRLAGASGLECEGHAMLIDLQRSDRGLGEEAPRPGEERTAESWPEPAEIVKFLKNRIGEMPPDRRAEANEKIGEMEKLLDALKDHSPEERKALFFEKAPVPTGPGGGPPARPRSAGGQAGGRGGGGGSSAPGSSGAGLDESGDFDFEEAEKHMERMESGMTATQRSDFFRTYVEKRAAN